MTKTVAIDLDGVIYDIIGHITDKFLYETHKGYRPNDWNCWLEFGISKDKFFEHYSDCWFECAHSDWYAMRYTDKDSFQLFKSIKGLGCRINVITKRANHNIKDTINYLQYLNLPFDQFTVITDYADKLNENFDIIIEDNPVNLPRNPKQLGILVDQAWNKSFELLPNHRRITNLLGAIPLIQNYLLNPLPSY